MTQPPNVTPTRDQAAPGPLSRLADYFSGLPDVAKAGAAVTAVLGVVGVSTTSLGTASRSATWVVTALVFVLILAVLVPAALRTAAEGARNKSEPPDEQAKASTPRNVFYVCLATLFAGAAALAVWAANLPSVPLLTATVDFEKEVATVTASSHGVGSLELLHVAVYTGVCDQDRTDGGWPDEDETAERLFRGRVGGDKDGVAVLTQAVAPVPDDAFVCVLAEVSGFWRDVAYLEVAVQEGTAADKEGNNGGAGAEE